MKLIEIIEKMYCFLFGHRRVTVGWLTTFCIRCGKDL